MNETYAERFFRKGLVMVLAGSVLTLSACSGEDDSAKRGAGTDADAVANKVFSPAPESPSTGGQEKGPVSPEARVQQPAAPAEQPAAVLRERLKAKGWKEVKGEDGSILLMPPKSP